MELNKLKKEGTLMDRRRHEALAKMRRLSVLEMAPAKQRKAMSKEKNREREDISEAAENVVINISFLF